jgi:predicted ATPase
MTSSRLFSLVGPGGVGKTRLALELCAGMQATCPDGVCLVELASVPAGEAALVPQMVARVLGLKETQAQPVVEMLVDSLKSRQTMLVLDGCEHLTQACAELTDALLRSCPQLRVLVTSRERLGIAGEVSSRVPSLRLPPSEPGLTPDELEAFGAVRLFLERARAADPAFALTAENAPAVVQICARLDGIPLALELAAARVRVLTAQQIAQRLGDRFRLLTDGSRTAPPRHHTLRALFDWSHDLLSDDERTVWRRLAVFVGGWTLEGAQRVCQCDDIEMVDLLAQLEEKSLVQAEEQSGAKRYSMLESVREYGLARLGDASEGASARTRHLEWCVALAEQAEPALYGPSQEAWLVSLEAEHGNQRAAIRWAVESGAAEAGLRLGAALSLFWLRRGYLREGQEWLRELLAAPGASGQTDRRAKACSGSGTIAFFLGDYGLAGELHQESLTIWDATGHRHGVARALNELGRVARIQGDYATARAHQERSLAVHRELGDKRSIAQSLFGLGLIAYHEGVYDAARAQYTECLALYRELGHLQAIAAVQGNLARVASVQGDYDEADARMTDSLTTFRKLGERWSIATALDNLGYVALQRGAWATARSFFAECLTVRLELGGKQGIAEILEGYGALAAVEGRPEQALRLAGAAFALRKEIDAPLGPIEQSRLDLLLQPARLAIGPDASARAWQQGSLMALDEALAEAR